MTMSLTRRTHRAVNRRALASLITSLTLVGGSIACRTTPEGAEARAAGRCDSEAPGTLRIANSSGRVLDVYVARPTGRPQLLTQVSPGTASLPVPGPTDLGARYDVVDPNAQKLLSTVNWNRRTGRETMVGVVVELACTVTPGDTGMRHGR